MTSRHIWDDKTLLDYSFTISESQNHKFRIPSFRCQQVSIHNSRSWPDSRPYLSNTTAAKLASANTTSPADSSLVTRRPRPFSPAANTSTGSIFSTVMATQSAVLCYGWGFPALAFPSSPSSTAKNRAAPLQWGELLLLAWRSEEAGGRVWSISVCQLCVLIRANMSWQTLVNHLDLHSSTFTWSLNKGHFHHFSNHH